MRICFAFPIAISLAVTAAAANAQLLSERVDGLGRICTYAGATNVISGGPTRELRVGIGQNCPLTHSAPETSGLPVPPTAQLRSETVTATGRACFYEQGGATWSLSLPTTQPCPLYAGMVERNSSRPRTFDLAINPPPARPEEPRADR